MYLFLIYSLILSTLINAEDPVHVCDPFPASLPSDPPIPELPDSFSTRVEINLNGESSSDVHVNFNYNRRKAAMIIQTANLETKLVFDYPTNEIHVIESLANYTQGPLQPGDPNRFGSPRVCRSVPLDTTDYLNYYFGVKKRNDSYFIPKEPLELFHLDFPQTYRQKETIRGISCDCYLSCVYRPETKQNFTLEFCFSTYNYSLPSVTSKFNRLPVRATYKGLVQIFNGSYVNFTEVHNYYDFRPNFVNEEFFQTPTDLVCLGRKPTKELPTIQKNFRFSEEESINGFTNYLKDLVYDGDLKMVRLELRPKTIDPLTFYVTDPLKIINDYNIGVSFNYNRRLKNCSITAIPASSLDEDSTYTAQIANSTSSYIIKLRTPESLLGLDSEYIYTGSRIINNIPGDNYVSDRTNISSTPLTMEYVFTSGDYGFETTSGRTINVPYTSIQRAPQIEFFSYATFYNFDQAELRYDLFDVTECFPKQDRIELRFKFPYKGIVNVEDLSKDDNFVKLEMMITLVTTTNEAYSRFSTPKVSISDDGNLYVRTAILPNPPNLAFFTYVPGKWLLTAALMTNYNIQSTTQCASLCLANIKCLSFDYSASSKTCFLNPVHGSQASLNPSGYDHYSRNTEDGFLSRPSYTLWNTLLNLTRSSKITLNIPINIDNSKTLIASDLDQLSDEENRFGTTSVLSKYNRAKPNKKFVSNKDSILFNQNIDDCARACSEELKYECQSFDFCYISGDCRLSSKFLSESDPNTDFVEEFQCDIYEKDSLFHYTEFPGKTTVNKKDKMYQAESAGDCAKKCDSETELHCRSFNYCPDQNSCYLSQNHLLDASEGTSSDLICTHFSRNYLSDFVFSSSANIPLTGDLVFENSNPETCALLCVTADGFNCKSFDFCNGTKKCLLFTDKPTGKVLNETDFCYNYQREYFYVTSTIINNSNSDSSSIVLTVLAVVFAVFGLALGAALSYFYVKKRKL